MVFAIALIGIFSYMLQVHFLNCSTNPMCCFSELYLAWPFLCIMEIIFFNFGLEKLTNIFLIKCYFKTQYSKFMNHENISLLTGNLCVRITITVRMTALYHKVFQLENVSCLNMQRLFGMLVSRLQTTNYSLVLLPWSMFHCNRRVIITTMLFTVRINTFLIG